MHRTLPIVFILSILICGAVFAETQEQAQSSSISSEVNTPSEAQQARLITAIEVRGNKAISTNTIISKMKARVGSPYQENIISDDLKRLYLMGFFDEGTKIDTENYEDGIKVIVTVVERPVIEKITFSGIMRLHQKEDKLKAQLKSKESQYLDYPSLAEDIQTLRSMYEKAGYNQAQITYSVNLNKQTNKVKVEFKIDEGKKVRIRDILVEGNEAFPRNRILKLIKTKRAWFFNPGVLKDEVLKEDMERIKAFYRREGYTDVEVSYSVSPDAKKPFLLYVNIKIREGKKYLVGNVSIEGNSDIPEKEILAKLSESVPGKVFSQEAMKQDIMNIQSLYFDKGYIACQVQETALVNSSTGRVDINYNIEENQIVYVNKIRVRGNVKTKDVVIRRELRIFPGDRFDGAKLRRSKERLQNLGFFDDISYDTQDTPVSDKKDLVVDVKETKTGAFSFGGGYSTVDKFVGFVEIEQKNFDWKNFPYFTGDGQDLKFRASIGSVSNSFDISFTEPWVFDYPVSFGFDLYRRVHKRSTDVGYGYDESVTGGDLRLGKELAEYLRGDLMYRCDRIKISNISDDATWDLKQEYGTNTISSLTPSLTYDSRDNIFDTKRGNILTGSFELAGGPFSGNKEYWKFFSRVSHYFPMPRNAVIEVRGRVGLGETYGDSDRIPIYERYFAGGASTIRGYEERKVGPVDPASKDPLGGNSLLIGNIEYTYPLFSFLKVAAFYDVGNVWEKVGDIGSSRDANGVSGSGGFKSGFGLGVRIKTPIGPILLDYGIPMNKAPGEEKKKSGGRLHFSASNAF